MYLFMKNNCCHFVAEAIAYLVLLKFLWGVWRLIYTYVLGSIPNFSKYGEWSVVTGCTDGIGLAFAKKLASKGQNVVLISRSPDKLKLVATEIEEKYKVSTKLITADFSSTEIYENISKQLQDLNVGVLINNVGVSYDHPEYFLDVDSTSLQRLLTVNMQSVVRMSQILLPGMVKKGKGIILNVSSGSAVQPTPLMSLYSATKQFVDCFSKSLDAEYSSKGITVQSVMPMFVATKMSKIRRPSLFIPSPEKYASSTLATIGRGRRTHGCLPHAIQANIFGMLPEGLFMWAASKQNLGIRARALKKKQSISKKGQ